MKFLENILKNRRKKKELKALGEPPISQSMYDGFWGGLTLMYGDKKASKILKKRRKKGDLMAIKVHEFSKWKREQAKILFRDL